jgi:hypothetical protein
VSWDRNLWGIEFIGMGAGEAPFLIGGGWHPALKPRFVGEPSRPILFTSRRLAHAWCAEKMAQYADSDICKHWRFRAVRVRETVCPTHIGD